MRWNQWKPIGRRSIARGGGTAVVAAAVALMGAPAASRAQVFYSYPGAKTVTDYSPSLGVAAGFGDHLIRLAGFARFNVSAVSDLGVEAVYQSVDSGNGGNDTGFGGAGFDFRYGIVTAGDESPLDVSAQAGFGFLARSDFLNIHAPLGGVVSRDLTLQDGRVIVPYGGVYVVIDHVSVDGPGPGNFSDTDADVELRLGASAEIVRRGSVFAVLHVGDDTMFFVGFNAGL